MAAGINDKFKKTFNSDNPNVTFVTTTRSGGSTTLICDSLTGWPTDTAVDFITYQLDTDGETVVAGSQRDWKGIVSSNTITNLTLIAGGSDAGSSVNDIVEMTPTGNWANDLISGILVGHDQDGTHKSKGLTLGKINGGSSAGVLKSDSSGNVTVSLTDTADIEDDAVTDDKIDFTSFDPTKFTQGGSETTTSTSYTNMTLAAVTGTYTTSEVKITVGGNLYNSGAGITWFGFAISGSTTLATADARAASMYNTNGGTVAFSYIATITPGTITVTPQKKVQSGTGSYERVYIIVEPVLNS